MAYNYQDPLHSHQHQQPYDSASSPAPAYAQAPPAGPQPRRGRTPAPVPHHGGGGQQGDLGGVGVYDQYPTYDQQQQQQYGGQQQQQGPFADPHPHQTHQQAYDYDQHHQQQQWAQPVAHHYPSNQYDPMPSSTPAPHNPYDQPQQQPHYPGQLQHDDSFVSHAPSNPSDGHGQQQQQDDDDDGAAPLLSPSHTGHHHHQQQHGGMHNRWSSNGQQQGGGYTGGFDPNVVGPAAYGGGGGMDDDQQSVVRYGRIPQRQPRRYKTVKRVQLYHGNLVLDCQVPPKLLERCPRKEDREFTHMRYTAATCDPNDFLDEQYSLRQILYETPRRTELFIVITMYNEDEVLFCRTMHGVMKNIQHLCERTRSKTWGADGWKKVVVCIVSDGRAKINSRTLSVLAAMGVYQDGVAKNVVAGKPVTAHIYEYTTQLSASANADNQISFKSAERGLVPVQILFCLKEKNAKKINSHRWFFNAFGPILQPNVCVLLDVGTQPGTTSIYKLWKTFDLNSNVGGACGEIVALKGKYFRNLLNPLVAAQNFEYKMSNILDKPLESVFGYITVLPGAFSAYRYIALQNDAMGEGPLKEYFKGETLHHSVDADLWTKNMYLAEDRILCWELVAKRGSAWLLHYQRSAFAVTDVPDTLSDLISQRRRWLNGSFFAGIHSSFHFGFLYRSDHSFVRKAWLHVELFYQSFNMLFAWFGLANYYIIFIILTQSLADPSFGLEGISYFNTVLKYYYIALLICCFLLALGNRPAGAKTWYLVITISFALITAYMLAAAIIITVKGVQNAQAEVGGSFSFSDIFANAIFRNIVISLLSTYGLYLVASLIFLDPAHMGTSFIQYLLIAPSYIMVINVYAFCNVQDVTWGNRPEEKQSTDLGVAPVKDGGVDVSVPTDEKDIDAAYDDACHVLGQKAPPEVVTVDLETKMTDSYRNIRTNVVLAWTLSNGALVAAIISTSAGNNISTNRTNVYMAFLLYSVAGLAFVRFCGSAIYSVLWMFQR